MAFDVPPGYRALKEADISAYLSGIPAVSERLGGKSADWKVREVGDGNLNLVFIIEGPASGVVLKQALPYLRLVAKAGRCRCAGAFFEYKALIARQRGAARTCPSSTILTRPWRSR